jgi:ABC-type uncharacterized transport system ATPase component
VFNMLSGISRPDAGRLDGADVTGAPSWLARAGVCRTFQNPRLFWNLTVIENVAVAVQSERGLGREIVVLLSPGRRRLEPARALLAFVGLADRADRLARSLSYEIDYIHGGREPSAAARPPCGPDLRQDSLGKELLSPPFSATPDTRRVRTPRGGSQS